MLFIVYTFLSSFIILHRQSKMNRATCEWTFLAQIDYSEHFSQEARTVVSWRGGGRERRGGPIRGWKRKRAVHFSIVISGSGL